ncbi:MAG: hypothetical protein NUV77_26580, partial [Thermoguttaceae bacterium]|nr:hypothetical protein [Thermoguttaceae bacterium]
MPHYKRGLDWVHQNTRMKVFMHNDGAIASFLPTLIEMGVDILNPVQTTAAGMDPANPQERALFADQVLQRFQERMTAAVRAHHPEATIF